MRDKEHERLHQHRPPWWEKRHEQGWEDGPSAPPWLRHHRPRQEWHTSGGYLFWRFVLVFGVFVLLGCGVLVVMGAAAALIFFLRPLPFPTPDYTPTPSLVSHPLRWILLLFGIVILLALALRRVGSLAARRITSPLSETMKAADSLAEGDLSARVPVQGSGEFRHFAHSFNRMAQSLETADRQRRELMADVAHELRTPLTVIQGNLEGLRDGVYEPTVEHLDLLLDETRKLSHLVDDLRILTLAEAGQLPLDLQRLDVPQLLADLRDAFAYQADEAGIHLALDVRDSLPPLTADPQRLGQVLGNLMTNALRHTPRGGEVCLGAAMTPERDGIHLWVADTGEGISAQDLPRIFDRFWRADPARAREAGAGSGLGLAIARSLVEAHGGHIWAESQTGQGTTVSCLLPLSTIV
jgi:signal transduction histidine kinase